MTRSLLDAFRALTDQAEALLLAEDDLHPSEGPLLTRFTALTDVAPRLLLAAHGPAIERLRACAPAVAAHWLETDLLSLANPACHEDPWTELMAWALAPETHPKLALELQRAWLAALRIQPPQRLTAPATPQTQLATDSGYPDLVMAYPDFVVVVEAKTGTEEHEASTTGWPQTIAYPPAVARALGRTAPPFMVFLTLDGHAPANPKARRATYAQFARVLATTVASLDLSPELRHDCARLVTALLNTSTRQPAAVRSLTRLLARSDLDETALLQHFGALERALALLTWETDP